MQSRSPARCGVPTVCPRAHQQATSVEQHLGRVCQRVLQKEAECEVRDTAAVEVPTVGIPWDAPAGTSPAWLC